MNMFKTTGTPLPENMIETIDKQVLWEDIIWGEEGVTIGDKFYEIDRIIFVPRIIGKG